MLDEAYDPRAGRQAQRWLPFKKYHYPKVFAPVRKVAVEGVPDGHGDWKVALCPSLSDFRDQYSGDLYGAGRINHAGNHFGRRHTAESATRILKHYLARHPEMADSAIGKMVAWYEGGGEAEFGL